MSKRYKMKNIHRLSVIVFAVLLFTGFEASAQRVKLNINYGVGIPSSANFKDYVSKTSLRGWNANLMYEVNDQLSLGLGSGSQSFYQRYPRDIYKTPDGSDISAVLTNTVTSIPLLVQGQFNLLPEAVVQPYVGLGVGGNLVLYNQYLGEFGGNRSKFGFAARPEAGVFIPVGKYKESSIVIGGSYNYLPIKEGNLENLNNIGIHAGFKFPLR